MRLFTCRVWVKWDVGVRWGFVGVLVRRRRLKGMFEGRSGA